MHAIRQHEFGPAENLLLEEVPDPEPSAGQVRIRVGAAGVHLVDTFIRSGAAGGPFPPTLPMTPGREVAGVVDRLGAGVDHELLGRRVVAHLGMASGGYAELAVVAMESLQFLPDSVSDMAAVATIGTGRTAMAILNGARIAASDVVLVLSAAGGIGSFAVQAARNAGATVIGLASAAKVPVVHALGAHHAIDYGTDDWPSAVREVLGDREVTVALDGVGGKAGRHALDLLGTSGRLLMYGTASGETVELSAGDLYGRGLTVSVPIGPHLARDAQLRRSLETQALAEVSAGRIVPLVNEPIPLAEAARAHLALENRAATGKVVLMH